MSAPICGMVVEGVLAIRSHHVGRGLGDVVEKRRGARHQVGLREVDRRERVPVDVVGVDIRPARRRSPRRARGGRARAARRLAAPRCRRSGTERRACGGSRRSHARRRGSTSCGACARIASIVPGASAKPSRATNRAARYMRNGSSAKVSAGSSGVRSTPASRSARPWPVRSITSPSRVWQSAFTVKSRRSTSSRSVPGRTSGLRELGVVALGAGANPLDDVGAAADLRGSETLETLGRVPAEASAPPPRAAASGRRRR